MVTYFDAIAFGRPEPRRMPGPVREAREAALGLAGFGILYPVVLGMTVGGSAAVSGALRFVPGVLMGMAALGFGNADIRRRRAALALALLQIVVAVRFSGISGLDAASDLGVIPLLTVVYACGISVVVLYLLTRPQAREWFGVV
ncbi:hypothetical protein [Nocardia bovistercoris]|uniref:Uncharacterized protein n=1 Tax=Nocardia bovistercoris TaxID=2785916 RepID=A0A931I5D6_9NOCA|nr:hypothetical protein [Nocardia bovistercoris]MBH0774879.1 hypothetical protein [Nocardia bovistercoris]